MASVIYRKTSLLKNNLYFAGAIFNLSFGTV